MTKSLLVTAALVASALTAQAQATLDAGNSNPVIGDKYLSYTSASHDGLLAGGAGVTWNFSAFSIVSTDTVRFVPCDASTFCTQYPGSNIVMKQNIYHRSWDNAGIDSLIQIGEAGRPWDDPKVIMRYPFTYNSVVQDSFKFYSAANSELVRGADTITGDGYGTLQVLGVSYPNVLRVHHTETRYDSFWAFPGAAAHSRTDAYEWYVPGHHIPKVVVAFTNHDGLPDTLINFSVQFSAAVVANVNAVARDLEVYPVPTRGDVNIRFAAGEAEHIKVSIADMAGRVVAVVADKIFDMGVNNLTYTASGLAKGLYCLRLEGEKGNTVRKITVE